MRNPVPETPWVLELRIPREKKGDYTQAARKRGMKLLPWIIQQCDKGPARELALTLLTLGLARIERSPHVPDLAEFCFDGLRYHINGDCDWVRLLSVIGWGRARAAIASRQKA
jgi:hypothetical protein